MQATGSADGDFKQRVLGQCYNALTSSGFTRFRKEGVDWPLDNDFHCWVGLNTSVNKTYVEINPFVGIHVVSIEKLWTSLKNGKYPGKYSRGVATYARHIGELAAEQRVFHFTLQTDIDVEARRLAQLYVQVGLTYARSIASYELLLPLLQNRAEMLGAYPERIAACLYLMGLKSEARSFTENFLAQRRDYFEGFAVPFIAMLNREAVA